MKKNGKSNKHTTTNKKGELKEGKEDNGHHYLLRLNPDGFQNQIIRDYNVVGCPKQAERPSSVYLQRNASVGGAPRPPTPVPKGDPDPVFLNPDQRSDRRSDRVEP